MAKRARWIRWFNEGVESFWASDLSREMAGIDAFKGMYPCPLCFSFLTVEDLLVSKTLTKEHAPPESFDGRYLVLTCKRCNDFSGEKFDNHLAAETTNRDLQLNRPGTYRVARHLKGVKIRGDYIVPKHGGEGIFRPVAAANNPEDLIFVQTVEESGESVPPRADFFESEARCNKRLAAISWTRSAYLAAFTLMGWDYIGKNSMTVLRTQFKDEQFRAPLAVIETPNAPRKRRGILIVIEPSIEAVIVLIGHKIIFLPWRKDSQAMNEVAKAVEHFDSSTGFPVRSYAWQTEPTYTRGIVQVMLTDD